MLILNLALHWVQVQVVHWLRARGQGQVESDKGVGALLALLGSKGEGTVIFGYAIEASGLVALVEGKAGKLVARGGCVGGDAGDEGVCVKSEKRQ